VRLLSFEDLKAKGVNLSRSQIHRLVKAGKFPAPIKLAKTVNGRNSWIEEQVDAHLMALATRNEAA
jgi:predicted DNA-binding transcriptional regulator AlpA